MINNLSIVKVNPTKRSHEKKPYYALVIFSDGNEITTYIPGRHELTIKHGTFEWDYHVSRWQKVGDYPEKNHLLFNQNLTFVNADKL